MSVEIGSAFLTIVPSARGFGNRLRSQIGGDLESAGREGGKKMGAAMATAAAAVGVGAFLKSAVGLEAKFSQTMATIGAAANVPKEGLKQLSDLAIKMGADTSFSAIDASEAMLELAKGGLSAATIQGGALKGTLTLAAAGGTDLGTAATIASNALNTFGLKGKDMAAVAAALAGGANASSASVESLGQGLSQVGPGAKNAGLSLQETIASLSAFDAAGIKGSDAGTSLKTMLARLAPQTDKAAGAMEELGLDFTDAKGNFVPIANVAQQLKDKLSGLSEEQRSTALTTMFGSDATRAATVMMTEGAAGIEKYIKAASDQGAAERVAAARMSGTAGALEALKGSYETVQLQLGMILAPAVAAGAKFLTAALNKVPAVATAIGEALAPVVGGVKALVAAFQAGGSDVTSSGFAGVMERIGLEGRKITDFITGQIIPAVKVFFNFLTGNKGGDGAGRFTEIALAGINLRDVFITQVIPAFNSVKTFILTQVVPAVMRIITAWQGYVAVVLPIVKAFVAGMMARIGPMLPTIRNIFKQVGTIIVDVMGLIQAVISRVTTVISFIWSRWGGSIMSFISGIWEKIFTIISAALGVIRGVIKTVTSVIKGDWSGAWTGIRLILSSAWDLIKGVISGALRIIGGVISGAWALIKHAASLAWEGILTVLRTAFRWIVDKWLGVASALVNGAAKAFGWVPGLGAKLKTAAAEFNTFRDDVNAALGGVKSRTVMVNTKFLVGGSGSNGSVIPGIFNNNGRGDGHGIEPRAGVPSAAAIAEATNAGWNTFAKNLDFSKIVAKMASGGAAGGGSLGGSGVARMMAVLHTAFPGLQATSGYRPGSITSTGNQSYHSMGRAVDLPANMAIFNWLRAKFGATSRELIFSPAGGRQIKNGKPLNYGEPVRGDHWDHVHWAYANGTDSAAPGYAWVGERGPEIVKFHGGEQVIPNHNLGSGGGDVNFYGNVGWDPNEVANRISTKQRDAAAMFNLAGV